jgi:4-diphosphocytidyl-2-C-methyl-D-erythritol kinase
MDIKEFAPAKVNLALHVTGQRSDGYHLLDSLVVFADIGDWIRVCDAPETTLVVDGPNADNVPTDGSNLAVKAAQMYPGHVALHLEKHLPAAAGIGGGSADAAATLRAIARLRQTDLPDLSACAHLGADIPVCMSPLPQRMQGIGEDISTVPTLPPLWMVLVNPGIGLDTPDVFKTLENKKNPGLELPAKWGTVRDFVAWLAHTRNDLQSLAALIAPVVTQVIDALQQTQPLLARMSGSGTTCFALFDNEASARAARSVLKTAQPQWWVQAAPVL